MAYLATNIFNADGVTTQWNFAFAGVSPDSGSGTLPYLYAADVKAIELFRDVDGNAQSAVRTVTINPTLPNRAIIDGAPVAAGRQIKIYRQTEIRYPLVDYRDRQTVSEQDLDLANRQAIFIAQETQDAAIDQMQLDRNDNYDANGHRVVNLAPGVDGTDAANMDQLRRTVRVPDSEASIPTLPTVDERKNKLASFDMFGNMIASVPNDQTAVGLQLAIAAANGGTYIGIMDLNLDTFLKELRIPVECFGAVGDYDPETETGTANDQAFVDAKNSGFKIQLKANANYMITNDLTLKSGMDWRGDKSYSPTIWPKFPGPHHVMIRSPIANDIIRNVSLEGFTLARIGQNAEHGLLVDNLDGFYADLKVTSTNTSAPGGAWGVSAIYPWNRPSKNFEIKANIINGGNFGVQLGNVEDGTLELDATDSMREVIGVEPQALARYDFAQAQVTADELYWPAHGLTLGYPLLYGPLGNPIIPALTRADYWFVIPTGVDTMKLASSKENAIAGTNVPLAAFTGTHCFLKCGIARNIKILAGRINTGDVPVQGTLTGIIDVTAASGGYHEAISFAPCSVTERNPTSGSYGLAIQGAHNIVVNDFQAVGCKLGGVLIDVCTVNNVFAAAGDIAPIPNITCVPAAVVVDNPTVREFQGFGVKQAQGYSEVRTPYAKSSLPGTIGLQVLAAASVRGSLMFDGTGDCPLGADLAVGAGGVGCRGVNTNSIRDRRITRMERQEIYKQIPSAPNAVCSFTNQSGAVTTYTGQLYVIARSATFDSSSIAAYWLDVILPVTGGTPVVSVVKSSGLTGGASSNEPSFTWSISGNSLIATPVSLTNPSKEWNFYISAVGDIALA